MFTFIESSAFERVCPVYLDDSEYAELQQFMMQNPEAGRVVPGAGGVRKLRWARAGMGKRGGVRVIYYFYNDSAPLYLLHAYAKAGKDDLLPHEKETLVRLVSLLKAAIKSKLREK